MTDRETLEMLGCLRHSALVDVGDLRAAIAIDKAIAAYRRELDQSEAERARTTVETILHRKLALARHHIEHLAECVTNYAARTPDDRECTVKAGLNWIREADL